MKQVTTVRKWVASELEDYKHLLRNIPSLVVVLFVISVVMMNLFANKEITTGVSWLALDCGLLLSWLSFLCMDILTKRFGAKASIKLSLLAVVINLFVCVMLFIVSVLPGNWGEFYTYENPIINEGLNSTFGGTWYVLLGSTIAFIASSVVNATINASIGKLLKKDNFKEYAIRSYLSTLFGQFVDNLIFALIVSHTFFGWTLIQSITCSLTGCLVELLCEVIFSPFGYKVCKTWERENVGDGYINYAHQQEER